MQVAWPTAKRWADRYRALGAAGMVDRSSRPHHSPHTTPAPTVRKIVHLRWKQRLGPVAIADRVGVAPSTAHRVLVRCRINRLGHLDRVTGEPIRRYEHPAPGDLLHVDVKKLGNIPDGGGWRYVGRAQGARNRAATPGKNRSRRRDPKMGTAFVHTVLDDHSRLAYAEIHDDERADTAVAVLRHAVAWFTAREVVVRRVLTDNGSAYRSFAWRDTCAELGITPKRTRPYRPQTNGKIERFHRTMADGWAFRRLYTGESQRRKALPGWLHEYNHHRPHTAIGGQPPISRLTNLPGQYT
jgi:transposase InsO family protein